MNASRTYQNRHVRACRYPNAAEKSYYIERFTDKLLCSASCIGIVVILFFLATM